LRRSGAAPRSKGDGAKPAQNHDRTHNDRDLFIALRNNSERKIANRDAVPLSLRNWNKERNDSQDQYGGANPTNQSHLQSPGQHKYQNNDQY